MNQTLVLAGITRNLLRGNATDLSLLTHISFTDIENIQAVEKDAQKARREFILRDDQDKVWQHISSLVNGRVDFVLDNAGFEVLSNFLPFWLVFHQSKAFHGFRLCRFFGDLHTLHLESGLPS